jgi:ABC-type transport system involved in multi-copper enzyme maturation permease subunit
MLKALMVKELREAAGFVLLALIGAVYVLAELTATPVTPWQSGYLNTYPFVNDWLNYYLWLLVGALAIVLGLRQTAWELGQGTYFFLLHRPVQRWRVFGLKLVIGAGLILAFCAGLILIYAWWAATPGNVPAPFEWSMTRSAWIAWAAIFPLYIGAFLSGIRPGRWYGTRLLPLAAAIGVGYLIGSIPWFWLSLCATAVASAFGIVSIFYYVYARDY